MRLERTLEVSVTVVITKFCIGPDNPRRAANDFDTKEFVDPLSKNANVLTPLTITATIGLYTLLLLALMLPLLIVWLETAASLLESRGFSAVCLSKCNNFACLFPQPGTWHTVLRLQSLNKWPGAKQLKHNLFSLAAGLLALKTSHWNMLWLSLHKTHLPGWDLCCDLNGTAVAPGGAMASVAPGVSPLTTNWLEDPLRCICGSNISLPYTGSLQSAAFSRKNATKSLNEG